MTCHDRQTELQDYLVGELAPAKRQDLEAHMSQCAGCRTDLEFYRVLLKALPTLPDPSVPDDLADHVLEAVRPQWAVLRRQRETATATFVRRSLLLLFAFGFVGTLGVALWGWLAKIASISAGGLSRDVVTLWEAAKDLWSLVALLGDVATVLQPTAAGLWTLLERLGAPLAGFGPLIISVYAAALALGCLLCVRAMFQSGGRRLHHAA